MKGGESGTNLTYSCNKAYRTRLQKAGKPREPPHHTPAPSIQLYYLWGFSLSQVRRGVPNIWVCAGISELQEMYHTAAPLINGVLCEATSNFIS